jgi:hypothetical protein
MEGKGVQLARVKPLFEYSKTQTKSVGTTIRITKNKTETNNIFVMRSRGLGFEFQT